MSGVDRSFSSNRGDEELSRHMESARSETTATPGMDNLGSSSVGGGISGIAVGVANNHDRHSGAEAFRSSEDVGNVGFTGPAERDYHTTGSDNPYIPFSPGVESSETLKLRDSCGSNVPLATVPSEGNLAHGQTPHSIPSNAPKSHLDRYETPPYNTSAAAQDGPYQKSSFYTRGATPLDIINPEEIADDGDDGFGFGPNGTDKRGTATAADSPNGGLRKFGMFSKNQKDNDTVELTYEPVPGRGPLRKYKGKGNRRRGFLVGFFLAFLVFGAIIGGIVGGLFGNRENRDHDRRSVPVSRLLRRGSSPSNGNVGKSSSESGVKNSTRNKNHHRTCPGMDYKPWEMQYPLCLEHHLSQNDVTRDMEELSRLTNNVRLHGTDCNQTEIVLHAIDRLGLTDMKVWLEVQLDTDTATNDRQLSQLYNAIDGDGDLPISGVIIGNEALRRAGNDVVTAEKSLVGYLERIKANFAGRNLDLPVATSDLGDRWNSELVQIADIAWTSWQGHGVSRTKGTKQNQVIFEFAFPVGRDDDCGLGSKCSTSTAGSVDDVDETNYLMSQ